MVRVAAHESMKKYPDHSFLFNQKGYLVHSNSRFFYVPFMVASTVHAKVEVKTTYFPRIGSTHVSKSIALTHGKSFKRAMQIGTLIDPYLCDLPHKRSNQVLEYHGFTVCNGSACACKLSRAVSPSFLKRCNL